MEDKTVGGERQEGFAVARLEKKVLIAIAKKLPHWVLPDDLTALGVVSAVLIAGCLYGSNFSRWWLIAVIPLLIFHWLGDSLDGTVARVRDIQRPKYGYYLDHLVDAFSTVVIGLGLGVSPYLSFGVASLAVICYLVLSINVYLEGEIFDRFDIGYANLGPTEMRAFLAGLMVTLFFAGPLLASVMIVFLASGSALPIYVLGGEFPILDFVVAALIAFMIVALIIRARRNLRQLAQEEPAAPRR